MTPAPTDLTALFSRRVRADGCACHFVVYETGVTIGSRIGRGRLVTFGEILCLSEGPPPDRYGVVVGGRLGTIYDSEGDAQDAAANQRTLGLDAVVIRVPAGMST